uniref:Uncharacterized protein n=1 Tax=Molossus molossus TaxID=27622 RepID=A0A7J8FTD7_MOLMO|nr:hypothetical protein HJG59_008316 [Molossus molossus]
MQIRSQLQPQAPTRWMPELQSAPGRRTAPYRRAGCAAPPPPGPPRAPLRQRLGACPRARGCSPAAERSDCRRMGVYEAEISALAVEHDVCPSAWRPCILLPRLILSPHPWYVASNIQTYRYKKWRKKSAYMNQELLGKTSCKHVKKHLSIKTSHLSSSISCKEKPFQILYLECLILSSQAAMELLPCLLLGTLLSDWLICIHHSSPNMAKTSFWRCLLITVMFLFTHFLTLSGLSLSIQL